MRLAQLTLEGRTARATALGHMLDISMRALRATRGSVWLLQKEDTLRLTREAARPPVAAPADHDLAQVPGYLEHLSTRRVLSVSEAANHPVTGPLLAAFPELRAATSLLDAPILREGKVVGVVRHEHEGEPRPWPQADCDFAASVADMAALLLEQADRRDIEVALQERREQRLLEAKMDALSLLARSVAHDTNNLLTVIRSASEELCARPEGDLVELGQTLREAEEMSTRLMGQLLAFGREGAGSGQGDLASVLRRCEPLLSALVRSGHLTCDVRVEPALVPLEATHLEQILVNLVTNAAEAIERGGNVRLELRAGRLDEPGGPARFVLACVDDGCGMDEETVERVFEPYFTRKGQGHGIGMSVVYGLVRSVSGQVLVDSALGEGTTVRVVLPRSRGGLRGTWP